MNDLVVYYSCSQQTAETYYTTNAASAPYNVNSGGFIFEFTDEYYKAGGPPCWLYQCPGTANVYTDAGPLYTVNLNPAVNYLDSAYFGLMAIGPGTPNTRTPRQSYCWYAKHWTGSYPQGCPAY